MGRHRKNNHRGTGLVADASPSGSSENTQSNQIAQTHAAEDGSALFARVRAEQKKAAAKRAEAERVTRFYQQSTRIGEAQFDESNALMYEEAAERAALQKQMRSEDPEMVKVVRAFVQETLNRAIRADEKRKAEKSCVNTQEMLHRHAVGDQEIKEHLSLWSKFQKKPSALTPEQQKRIAERNKDATAELHRRTEAAKAQRMGLFRPTTRSSSPTFDVVGNEETQQQSTVPQQPKRWW